MTNYYTPPIGNQTAGFYEIFKYVNSTVGGIFWSVMLLVIWVVTFMGLKQYSSSRAWTFASFFCSVISIILAVIDLISPRYMYLSIFLTLIGLVWLKLEAES